MTTYDPHKHWEFPAYHPIYAHGAGGVFDRICTLRDDVTVSVSEFRDVIIPPGSPNRKGGNKYKIAGAFRRSGEIIPETAYLRYGNLVVDSDLKDLREAPEIATPQHRIPRAIWGGHCFQKSGYGHYLVEAFCRFWYALENTDLPVVMTGWDRATFDWMCQHFKAMRFDFSRLVFVGETVAVDELIVPSQSFYFSHSAGRPWAEMNRALAPDISDIPETDVPLYISRGHRRGQPQRIVIGEHILERILSENGFEIFNPVSTDFGGVMAKHARHKRHLGFIGSAFHHNAFQTGREVHYFVNSFTPFKTYSFALQDTLLGHDFHFACFDDYLMRDQPKSFHAALYPRREGPEIIDFTHVFDYLYRHGLTRRRIAFTLTKAMRADMREEIEGIIAGVVSRSKIQSEDAKKLGTRLEERLKSLGI